jgi:hypothetical protein
MTSKKIIVGIAATPPQDRPGFDLNFETIKYRLVIIPVMNPHVASIEKNE